MILINKSIASNFNCLTQSIKNSRCFKFIALAFSSLANFITSNFNSLRSRFSIKCENPTLERIPAPSPIRSNEESIVAKAPLVTPTSEESELEDEDEELDPIVKQYGPLMVLMTYMAAKIFPPKTQLFQQLKKNQRKILILKF